MRRRTWGIAMMAVVLSGQAVMAEPADRYWDLGVGCYYGGMKGRTDLDAARFDWLCVMFGNIPATKETVDQLNRLLEINPDLKFLVRLWPIGGLGDCPQNRNQATFLHYAYQPKVRQAVLERTREQVRVVLDNIDRPENVVGFTFLEELPAHFTGTPFSRNVTGDEVTWDLERFRKEIEAERGEALRWDDATRQWWTDKWVKVLDEIHGEIKAASEDRLVFYWLLTGRNTMDLMPANTPTDAPRTLPAHLKRVVKPGKCDGIFAYVNNQSSWQGKYIRLAEENDWTIFSQVSMPGRMRLSSWDDTLRMAKQRFAQNLGYFLYVEGDEGRYNVWNVIPDIPADPRWRIRDYSEKLLLRRHLAKENVGMDVVRAYPAMSLAADVPLASAKAGGFLHVRAVVRNTREPSFFLDADEAVMRAATVTLAPPAELTLDPSISAPATIKLGDLEPGAYRVADWWLKVDSDYNGKLSEPIRMVAAAEQQTNVELLVRDDTSVPIGEAREIAESPWTWIEPGYRLSRSKVKPIIEIEALTDGVRNPGVGNELARITYRGVLNKGQRLTLNPDGDSRLSRAALVLDVGESRKELTDQTGYRAAREGYVVGRVQTAEEVTGGEQLRVMIAGKVEGDAQSQVVLRFVNAAGEHSDVATLVNRFDETWQTTAATITIPTDAERLTQVFLYRRGDTGAIWYGPLRVEATTPRNAQSLDHLLDGDFPDWSNRSLNVMHYHDDLLPASDPRVRVQLKLPGRTPALSAR